MTDARPPIPAGIREAGVVAVARTLTADTVRAVADGLLRGGVRALEITLNHPEERALETLGVAVRHAEGTNLDVGAGTVLTIDAAGRAIDAGATFLVSPHTDPGLIEWAAERDFSCFPGAFTPTEILDAWRAGAAAVKLFPASVAGPSFVREFRGPFPHIPLLPTGGVTADTAPDFIRAGAIAVGLGSWLIGDGEPAGLADRAAMVAGAVNEARQTR